LIAEAVHSPLGGEPSVTDLVARACDGDQQGWDALVDRYSPLIWWICRQNQLADADAADVSHSVWLQLVDHLDLVRDPAALAGWLARVTWRECRRILPEIPDQGSAAAAAERPLAERHAALFAAYSDLPPSDQRLIDLLTAVPREPDAKIGAALGIPVAGIAPARRRCLARLRRHPAIAALISAGEGTHDGGGTGDMSTPLFPGPGPAGAGHLKT
jgi:DNA-directed RNA polymerase specialized sigma24 family protein